MNHIERIDLDAEQTTSKDNTCTSNLEEYGDDIGQMLGKMLGGSNKNQNIFLQSSKINRGEFKAFERNVYNIVQDDGKVLLKWDFEYANGGTRPTAIIYKVLQGGKEILRKTFEN